MNETYRCINGGKIDIVYARVLEVREARVHGRRQHLEAGQIYRSADRINLCVYVSHVLLKCNYKYNLCISKMK